jgi:ZIP family zinc transporter
VGDLAGSLVCGVAVAASLLAGALLAAGTQLPAKVAAAVTAFGGGALFAAVALELVPEADERAGRWLTAGGLLVGTMLYVGADAWLSRGEQARTMRRAVHAAKAGVTMPASGSASDAARGESIAVGIFVDGVPESVALGLTVALGHVGVALLAGVLIGNVVEAYGAAQPIIASGRSTRFAIVLLAGIGLALTVATVLGGTVLAGASPALIGSAEALAAGAVLAVVSISIIPYAFDQVSSWVAAAAVLGFVVGYLLS